ncbi:hypothetical protein RJ639_038686 [Escallonia herrerae]|uniref:Uncharacterized protein n=1 Tax=Escallonia herrerae TaxID=1293975 RepID=A0AA88WJ87_9ASTE|nr:hypothetical protein RJ639_038686 [Escallonia herrerae]
MAKIRSADRRPSSAEFHHDSLPEAQPVSGGLFSLSYDDVQRPYLKYFRFSPERVRSDEVEIPLAEPTMMHDFAITEKYLV